MLSSMSFFVHRKRGAVAVGAWASLGFVRGITQEKYRANKRAAARANARPVGGPPRRPDCDMLTSNFALKLGSGVVGALLYVFPLSMPFVFYKEMYRLELYLYPDVYYYDENDYYDLM